MNQIDTTNLMELRVRCDIKHTLRSVFVRDYFLFGYCRDICEIRDEESPIFCKRQTIQHCNGCVRNEQYGN